MLRVEIDRAKWRRGDHKMNSDRVGETRLLNSDGMMCCLGFCEIELGIEVGDMLNEGYPDNIKQAPNILVKEDGDRTELTRKAVGINDDEDITEAIRESLLKKLGRKFKVLFIFKGRTPKEYWARKPSK